MRDCKEIYLVGPGSSKLNFDPSILKDKTTLSFSSDLMWFNNNQIYPTYWTFIDPNSIINILNKLDKGDYNKDWSNDLKKQSTIIFNEFQGTNDFYLNGFTTSRGSSWNKHTFGNKILPMFCENFKEIIKLPTIVLKNNYSSFYKDNQSHLTPIIKHEPNINTDKFSCYVIPLVISYFTKVKTIRCIGFGDFNSPRLHTGSSLGYNGYKSSYQRVKNELISLLKYKDINVIFNNKDSYFKELEWKK